MRRQVLDRLGIADELRRRSSIRRAFHEASRRPTSFSPLRRTLGTKPAACLGIEDAAAGIVGLKAAGMAVIGVGDPNLLHEADWVTTQPDSFQSGHLPERRMSTSLEVARSKWMAVIEGAGLSRRISLLYAAIYLHYGVYGVFMPLWFQHKGMSASQIGTLLALPTLLRILFVAPVTALADRLRRVREVLFVCIAVTAALVLVLSGVNSYVALLVFFTLFAVAWDPLPILADGYASAAVRVRNLDFGRMRMWGTIALVSASMAGGRLLDRLGVESRAAHDVPVVAGAVARHPVPAARQVVRRV